VSQLCANAVKVGFLDRVTIKKIMDKIREVKRAVWRRLWSVTPLHMIFGGLH
jgi:hypothetical protein